MACSPYPEAEHDSKANPAVRNTKNNMLKHQCFNANLACQRDVVLSTVCSLFMNSGRGLLALEAGPGIPDPWVSGPEYKRSNQCVRQMCAPKCCAEFSVRRILRRILCRILGAPNFAPNFCAEFCLQKMSILLGKIAFLKNWARPKFGTQIRRKIRHTQNSAHTSAQNSAHRKFGATFRRTHLAYTLVGSFVLGARNPRIWDPWPGL